MNDFEALPLGETGQRQLRVRIALAGAADDFFGAGDGIALVVGGGEDLNGAGDALTRQVAGLVDGDLADLAVPDPAAPPADPELSRRTYVYPWNGRRRRLAAAALARDATSAALRVQGDRLARELRTSCRRAGFIVGPQWRNAECLAALAEGVVYGNFKWDKYKTRKAISGLEEVVLLLDTEPDAALTDAVERAVSIAGTGMVAKGLTLEPPDRLYPETLAARAVEIAADLETVRCESWSAERIRDERLVGLLTVGRGSAHPVSQVEYVYEPPDGYRQTVVLVGKGVTYDCGGLQDKGAHMNHMNRDMAGAAAVIAMMRALDALRPKVRVIGLAGAAENMNGPDAYKTDDILVHRDGKTVQIGHTDAEGRVVLYDQLVYAREAYAPDLIIDMATLTGAVRFALGTDTYAVMCNKQGTKERDRLLTAARRAGEKAWPLPLSHDLPNAEYVVADYEKNFNEVMHGTFSDLDNDGDREYGAGSSKGAAFLSAAVDDKVPWLHLDVAFTAMDGPMGSPVPTLCHLLMDMGS